MRPEERRELVEEVAGISVYEDKKQKAMNELDELLETGFGGREATLVESMVEELEAIERDTDRMQIEVRRALYALEKELPPVDVMFLYKIIDWVGDVADRAERVGNRLEQLLAR